MAEMGMLEHVAREMCWGSGQDPDAKSSAFRWRWQEFLPDAQSALRAIALHMGAYQELNIRAYAAMIDAALTEGEGG